MVCCSSLNKMTSFLSVVYLLLSLSLCGSQECPAPCRCTGDEADCSHINLNFIPKLPLNTEYINISGNVFEKVSNDTFRNITLLNVRKLDMSNCSMITVNRAFGWMKNLSFLNISNNRLDKFNLQNALTSLATTSLTCLDLSSQSEPLSEIDISEMFTSLFDTPLRFLHLKMLNLRQIHGSFHHLKELRELYLDDNAISKMNTTGLENLEVLSLRLNEFNRDYVCPLFCTESDQPVMPNLTRLDLSQNHISDLLVLKSECLPSLTHLQLSYNPVRIIRNQTFSNFPRLETLHLDNLFSVEIILESLSLNSSSLKRLFIGNFGKMTPAEFNSSLLFRNLPSLVTLDMAHIFLMGSNTTDLFESLNNLEELVLKGCHLLEIPPIISKMTSLKQLKLDTNFIGKVHFRTFQNLHNLSKISLHENRISVIDNNSFSEETLRRLEHLDLRFNPFACNCDLYWFRNEIIAKNPKILVGDPRLQYTCYSPQDKYNTSLYSYNPTHYECHELTALEVTAISTACVFIFLIILIVLYKKYKWHIKYYAYLIRSKKGYERLNDPVDGEFLFDAFVAYNEDDRSWVITNLMSELEGKEQYRLCLHERDFLPGKTIFSQISHTIQRSRKVILVISNSFAKSQWCQYEAMMAQHRLVEDGANVLIIVLLYNIKSKYMTDSLQMLLRSMTYIEWTSKSTIGRELFWNKLKAAMKP